jgi:Chaperone of endosialidase
MGGKSSTSTQQITIPPEVLARYNAVNAQAQQVAATPFQKYGGEFVAPVNQQQYSGIGGINQYAGAAQPYLSQAGNLTSAANAGINTAPLSAEQIQQYYSPYMKDVAQSTEALLNQQNQQAMAGQLGNAIQQGAFGGDRAGIAAANLAQQQQLAGANIYSGLENTGYQQALQAAQQQQQYGLTAAQAKLAAAGQLAGIGEAAQTAGLQGAQAQIGAGSLEQQTQQAQDAALYNQFLQQQSYPFQVVQWLANIAEGTGALSGSTTTTTQPGGFFSDRRVKENIQKIGKDFSGQPLYRFNYKGDPRTQVGYIAQEIEKSHPDAVGETHGIKTVDYAKASDEAAHRGHYYKGGLVPASMGGHVAPEHMGEGYSYGGVTPMPGIPSTDMAAILAAQAQMYAPYGSAGLYGSPASAGAPHGGVAGYVPQANLPVSRLTTAEGKLPDRPTVMENMKNMTDFAKSAQDVKWGEDYAGVKKMLSGAYDTAKGYIQKLEGQRPGQQTIPTVPATLGTSQQQPNQPTGTETSAVGEGSGDYSRGGLAAARFHYEDGGYADTPIDTSADNDVVANWDYSGKDKLNIPEVAPNQKLAVAPPLQKQDSGLSQLSGLLNAANSLKNLFGGKSGGSSPSSSSSSGFSPNPTYMGQAGDVSGPSYPSQDVPSTVPQGTATVEGAPNAQYPNDVTATDYSNWTPDQNLMDNGNSFDFGNIGTGYHSGGVVHKYAKELPQSHELWHHAGLGAARKHYDTGGMPYSQQISTADGSSGVAPSSIGIPNNSASAAPKLQTAASLPTKPTGLQNAAAAAGLLGGVGQFADSSLGQSLGSGLSSLGSSVAGLFAPSAVGGLGAGMGAADALGAAGGLGAGSEGLASLALLAARGGSIRKRRGYDDGGSPVKKEKDDKVVPSIGVDAAVDSGTAAAPPPADTTTQGTGEGQGVAAAGTTSTTAAPVTAETPKGLAAADSASTAAAPAAVETSKGLAGAETPVAAADQGDSQSWLSKKLSPIGKPFGLDKKENLIPFLSFLSAMGTAPTRSLGVALASGIGAGAKTAAEIQRQMTELGFTQQELGLQQVAAETNRFKTIQDYLASRFRPLDLQPDDPNNVYFWDNTSQSRVKSSDVRDFMRQAMENSGINWEAVNKGVSGGPFLSGQKPPVVSPNSATNSIISNTQRGGFSSITAPIATAAGVVSSGAQATAPSAEPAKAAVPAYTTNDDLTKVDDRQIFESVLAHHTFDPKNPQADPHYWLDIANSSNPTLTMPQRAEARNQAMTLVANAAGDLIKARDRQLKQASIGSEDLQKTRQELNNAAQQRPVQIDNIKRMVSLLNQINTGAYEGKFNDLKNKLTDLGFALPASIKDSNAAFYEFEKFVNKNMLDQAQNLGGRMLVNELQGLRNSFASSTNPYGTNADILARQHAILLRENDYNREFQNWLDKNPGATNSSQFNNWFNSQKQYQLSNYIRETKKDIATDVPSDKKALVPGQLYKIRGNSLGYWVPTANDGQGGFSPTRAP